MDSIVNGAFEWDPEKVKQAEAQFKSVDDVVAIYKALGGGWKA
jgi:outer membrane protein TolC